MELSSLYFAKKGEGREGRKVKGVRFDQNRMKWYNFKVRQVEHSSSL